MASTKQIEQAEDMLLKAIAAKDNHNYRDALDLYQASLAMFLELYKIEPNGTPRKEALLSILQSNMQEAELLKVQLSSMEREEKREMEEIQNESKDIEPPSDGSIVSSIFSFFKPQKSTSFTDTNTATDTNNVTVTKNAQTNNSKPNQTTTKAKSITNNNKTQQNSKSKPQPLPDFYNYAQPTTASINNSNKKVTSVTKINPALIHNNKAVIKTTPTPTSASTNSNTKESKQKELNDHEQQILTEMLDSSPGVRWNDIAGLQFAKQTLQEAVILPNLRPDLFTGLRSPPKGVLLFGPPGTGKTLLAKAVATESGFCFFSISSSSVTSKYLGEGEKLMKALFEVARMKQPSVIFFDEIDALMSARKENEHEASRRIKTEFMTQVDGAATNSEDRILIMAATNIPWEIDEAVLRRLAKRIYVPLPDEDTRTALILHLLSKQTGKGNSIDSKKLNRIVTMTSGYSGSDLTATGKQFGKRPNFKNHGNRDNKDKLSLGGDFALWKEKLKAK
eukprot:gene10654-14308_t